MKVSVSEKLELIRALTDFTLLRHNFNEKELNELEVYAKQLSKALKANPIPEDEDIIIYDHETNRIVPFRFLANGMEMHSSTDINNMGSKQKTISSLNDSFEKPVRVNLLTDSVCSKAKVPPLLDNNSARTANRLSLLERNLLKHQTIQTDHTLSVAKLGHFAEEIAAKDHSDDQKVEKINQIKILNDTEKQASVIKNKITLFSTDSDSSPRKSIHIYDRKNEKNSLEKYLNDAVHLKRTGVSPYTGSSAKMKTISKNNTEVSSKSVTKAKKTVDLKKKVADHSSNKSSPASSLKTNEALVLKKKNRDHSSNISSSASGLKTSEVAEIKKKLLNNNFDSSTKSSAKSVAGSKQLFPSDTSSFSKPSEILRSGNSNGSFLAKQTQKSAQDSEKKSNASQNECTLSDALLNKQTRYVNRNNQKRIKTNIMELYWSNSKPSAISDSVPSAESENSSPVVLNVAKRKIIPLTDDSSSDSSDSLINLTKLKRSRRYIADLSSSESEFESDASTVDITSDSDLSSSSLD